MRVRRCRSRIPLTTAGLLFFLALGVWACAPASDTGEGSGPNTTPGSGSDTEPDMTEAADWIPLFNGQDLSGWTPKISGQPLGKDPWETFRVEDGLLTVSYQDYDGFKSRFGHLFYQQPFSHYQLRVEYRFLGEQLPDGPEWAFKNSGIMFHAQNPELMLLNQSFPLSLEAQLLGGGESGDRPTANVCTPGTHIERNGVRLEDHCVPADAPTIRDARWVTLDLIVRGEAFIAHIMGGDTVLAYSHPTIGGGTVEEFGEMAWDEGRPLTGGFIALQSESHPIQFRQVLLRPLPSQEEE